MLGRREGREKMVGGANWWLLLTSQSGFRWGRGACPCLSCCCCCCKRHQKPKIRPANTNGNSTSFKNTQAGKKSDFWFSTNLQEYILDSLWRLTTITAVDYWEAETVSERIAFLCYTGPRCTPEGAVQCPVNCRIKHCVLIMGEHCWFK